MKNKIDSTPKIYFNNFIIYKIVNINIKYEMIARIDF
jgi:hypothetical protein